MTTGLRRILLTALLVGLGLIVTLHSRRPHQPRRIMAPVAQPVPVASPTPAPRTRDGMRGALVAGLAGLLLVAGFVGALVANREALFTEDTPSDGNRAPPAAQALPNAGPSPDSVRTAETSTLAAVQPDHRAETDPSAAVPNREGDAPASNTAPPAEEQRRSDLPVAGMAETASDTVSKVGTSEPGEGERPFGASRASTEAGLRLVLGDTRIAPAAIGLDGTVTFGPQGRPEPNAIMAEAMDVFAGEIRGRTETPSSPPDAAHHASERLAVRPEMHSERPAERDDAAYPSSTGSVARAAPARSRPEPADPIAFAGETILIAPGDSLWAISRRTYGEGRRYTAIHAANGAQISNPDLIFPGQILVLPSHDMLAARRDGRRN